MPGDVKRRKRNRFGLARDRYDESIPARDVSSSGRPAIHQSGRRRRRPGVLLDRPAYQAVSNNPARLAGSLLSARRCIHAGS